jgi:hypothetical protein
MGKVRTSGVALEIRLAVTVVANPDSVCAEALNDEEEDGEEEEEEEYEEEEEEEEVNSCSVSVFCGVALFRTLTGRQMCRLRKKEVGKKKK